MTPSSSAPKRRKVCPKSRHEYQDIYEQSWTTARCNRLLRPITSKLNTIRASVKAELIDCAPIRSKDISTDCQLQRNISPTQAPVPTATEDTDRGSDSDWAPFTRRKLVIRQYGSRPATKSFQTDSDDEDNSVTKANSQPGEIIIPTPYMDKSMPRPEFSPPYVDNSPISIASREAWEVSKGRPRQKRYLPKATVIDGLQSALETLLKITSEEADPCLKSFGDTTNRKACRSLLGTCLRTIPGHIAEEQRWRRQEDAEDKSDVSGEIYSALEAFGYFPGSGWPQLREVVRAHGFSLLCEAGRERILDLQTLASMVHRCLRHRAYDEAQDLLLSFSLAQEPLHLPLGVEHVVRGRTLPPCLQILNDLTRMSGRRGFRYRLLTAMISSKVLPVEWLANVNFTPLWRRAIWSISHEEDDSGDAAKLAEATILCACGIDLGTSGEPINVLKKAVNIWTGPFDMHFVERAGDAELDNLELHIALRNTVSSLCTVLSAIALASQDSADRDTNSQTFRLAMLPVRAAAISIIRAYDLEKAVAKPRNLANIAIPAMTVITADIVLALCGIGIDEQFGNNYVRHGIRYLGWLSDGTFGCATTMFSASEDLSTLICGMARSCGKALRIEGFVVLQRIVRSLTGFRSRQTTTDGQCPYWYLDRLALSAAVMFANHSGVPDQIAFARTLADSNGRPDPFSTSKVPHEPFSTAGLQRSSFRWEDGICEWVPASLPRSLSAVKARPSLHDHMSLSPLLNRSLSYGRLNNLHTGGKCHAKKAFLINKRPFVQEQSTLESEDEDELSFDIPWRTQDNEASGGGAKLVTRRRSARLDRPTPTCLQNRSLLLARG